MGQGTNSSWIDKLKSAKKAGLLQNGIVHFYYFSSFLLNLLSRSKKGSLYIL